MLPDFIFEWSLHGMFLFVLGITGMVALVLHLLLMVPPFGRLMARFELMSPVLQALTGTLFVLSVTFLASSVWATEDRARELVNQEARGLHVVHVYMEQMTASSRNGFVKLLSDYADAVENEWETMASRGGSPKAEAVLDQVYRATMQGFAEGDTNRTIQQRILSALDELSTARQRRLNIANEGVTNGQWFTVISLGLLLLVVISICHVKLPAARGLALILMSLAIAISLFVIIAHDRPFLGKYAISPEPILKAARVPPQYTE
jgi:hypothetical protein